MITFVCYRMTDQNFVPKQLRNIIDQYTFCKKIVYDSTTATEMGS